MLTLQSDCFRRYLFRIVNYFSNIFMAVTIIIKIIPSCIPQIWLQIFCLQNKLQATRPETPFLSIQHRINYINF